MNRKININVFFYYASITSVLVAIFFQPYIINFTHSSLSPLFLIIIGIFFLFLTLVKNPNLGKGNFLYIFLSILCIIPCFYKNAYFMDGNYYKTLIYILTIIFFIFLYMKNLDEKKIRYIINFIIYFSILTSLVTWFGHLFPEVYRAKIIPLLPIESRASVLSTFPNINPGLTSHYSRNAFFITIGIMSLIYMVNKNKKEVNKKTFYMLIIFLFITLFLVGKRGHLIFLLGSFLLSYFIYYKVNIKTIIRIVGIILLFIIFGFLVIRFVPGTNKIYDRLFNNNQEDYSSGRTEMYEDIRMMYRNNNNVPIGWGRYSKNTNYFHPGVHNDYIQIFYETGIIGTIMIIGSNLIFLYKSIKGSKYTDNYLVFLVLMYDIFFMLYSLTGLPHYDFEIYAVYFMLNCCLFNILKKEKIDESLLISGGEECA